VSARLAGELAQLLAEGGLPDARLADEHDQGALTGGRLIESDLQLMEFGRPARQRTALPAPMPSSQVTRALHSVVGALRD
jgi:hypothetical protein